ncbi:hypothetical protein Bca52824_039611 [Brassica carinata]|uniref:Uncharacterized protein n=1 Tax=Brassica carinata TaxID=52824 RepID=A0A8X7RRX7_BRACI|nr:hypothetical protein Bca52824_039611 [Brassica carinata]
MSKRSSSSIPTTADMARLKRRMESPVPRSDSSSEASEGSDCDLMAPLPLSCVYAATPLVVHASSVAGTHHAPSEGERAVLRVRQLPVDRRQVNFLVRETVLQRSSLWRGNTNDPFAAYQEAAKVMSAKKGSSSRNPSGDEVMITGSRRSSVVKLEPSPSLPGKRPKSGGVMTRSAQQTADMARSAGNSCLFALN